ncbi:globin-like [Bombus vosnesenskii]|uniref:Globin-like n=2 Tax=Pyrobombus TaxID=144703 RepID=A0A6J3KIE8_9HYME|nr:globin-like [Bombus vancouverensis nearcticus]XP_033302510.1 globin-like [Bombus bifarius]XP_033302511.1 globin-like [Bombus bifarius]XP_033352913.1 globin-like [Bombus vosnesenskii]XP_050479700.1 globin-like [Bombus huntii]
MGSMLTYFLGNPDDDVVDPKLGLTNKEKRIVRETWAVLRANSVKVGVDIMISYFKRFPQHHRAFPPFKDIPADDLLDNKKFHAHCQGIMSTLNDAIDALDDIDLVDAILHTTGKRHGRRGQGRQEFIDLKGVVMDAMRGAFGSKFTTEVEVAWDKAIDVLFSKIFEGEDMI